MQEQASEPHTTPELEASGFETTPETEALAEDAAFADSASAAAFCAADLPLSASLFSLFRVASGYQNLKARFFEFLNLTNWSDPIHQQAGRSVMKHIPPLSLCTHCEL